MIDKKYNHLKCEKDKYENWLKSNYFKCGNKEKNPFSIVIPPPNVTGRLHLGHAWDTTLQDIIIRYKKMNGFDTLWLPGMDHAGIATQAKIDAKLKKEGINPREMDREEWLKKAWEWKDLYSKSIREQWGKLGLSLDYSKERFTLDEGLSDAVKHIFIKLYEEGLIYRGERIINWDPEAMTALSNEEVIYKDIKGAFYHIKYMIEGTNDYLEIATTRPETMFGDTAIAVNKDDERYKSYIGKKAIIPIINKPIEIIADQHADPEFGTGVVKITPAHDPNDFEVGNRHGLERIICINPDGTMNENADCYQGLDRFECRKKLIKDLEKENLLIKIEEITHSVGHSERTDTMIEPYLSKQWFVKMESLAKNVLENQKDKKNKINFIPKRFEKQFIHWMDSAPDWCISRQLWWGHRIPAWYKDDKIYVGENAPEENGWIQDPDVLDTWFSSALWPFSTLGWPENTEDFIRYYPNSILITGYDIIPFWVCRMAFQGLHFTGKFPFEKCLIHGLIRDKDGRKMSKSLGNGVDPMDVIENYGADALRYFLTTSSALGMDLRYDEEKVKSTWNFLNKIWNASRFVLMNLEGFEDKDNLLENLNKHDKWILHNLDIIIDQVRHYMEKYEFNNAGSILYNFIWNDFCDHYIEMAKMTINDNATKSTLLYTLTAIIKLLHPFTPFITDEIYNQLPIKDAQNIMIDSYPIEKDFIKYNNESQEIESLLIFIMKYRNIIAENNITKNSKVKFNSSNNKELIKFLLKIDNDRIIEKEINQTKYEVVSVNYSMTIFYDKEETENDKILKEKQITLLENSISRRKSLLANENYLNKAPADLVKKEKFTLLEEEKQLETLKDS